MYAEERQTMIVELARTRGRVGSQDLAGRLGVTQETIRRDLSALAMRGLLRRVHGGAIPAEFSSFEAPVVERSLAYRDEKLRIAARAAEELPDEGAILLDAGTTTAALAELLPADRELIVITSSLSIALGLASRPGITAMSLGGRVRERTFAAVDSWALRALEEIYVDVAFLGVNGISSKGGFTTHDPAEAEVKRMMLSRAERSVVLADHSKFERDHLTRFAAIADADLIISATALEDSVADEVRGAGAALELA